MMELFAGIRRLRPCAVRAPMCAGVRPRRGTRPAGSRVKRKGNMMNRIKLAGICLLLAAAPLFGAEKFKDASEAKALLAKPGATDAEKFDASRYLAEGVAGGWSTWTPQFEAYYIELVPEEEYRKMGLDYRRYLEEALKLRSSDAQTRIDLGSYLAYLGESDKALDTLKPALAATNLTARQQADILIWMAESACQKGDMKAAKAHLEDLVSRKLNTAGRYSPDPAALAADALDALGEDDLDALKMPVYSDAKVYPAAQQAEYTDVFAPLSKGVALVLGKDIKTDDARVKMLKAKFSRFGIPIDAKASFAVRINTGEIEAPAKPEGYAVKVSKEGALLQGHDMLGTTWAVVSLIQLVDQQKKTLRICSVSDWPDVLMRSHTMTFRNGLEIDLFCKIDCGCQQTMRTMFFGDTPLRKLVAEQAIRRHRAFGLDYMAGDRSQTMYPKFPLTSERTFQRNLEHCSWIAAAGGIPYLLHDDSRHPLHPQDVKRSGNAAKQDMKYFTRLYRAVKEKYPGFRMHFGPVFYWGPYYSPGFKTLEKKYNEPWDKYNEAIKKELDPEIMVTWTGNRLVTYDNLKSDTDWAFSVFGRKPFYWQNRPGLHNGDVYPADVMPWSEWYFAEWGSNVSGHVVNSGLPSRASMCMTMGDALWNMKGYRAAESVRRALDALAGKGFHDIVKVSGDALAELDGYRYREFTPLALTEIPRIESCVARARKAFDEARAKFPGAMNMYAADLELNLTRAESLLKSAKAAAPDHFQKAYKGRIDATRGLAVKEAGLDEAKGDIFRTAADFLGGTFDGKRPADARFGMLLRAAGTPINRLGIPFDAAGSAPLELILCGSAETNRDLPVAMRITLNGKTLFDGACGLPEGEFGLARVKIPAGLVKPGRNVIDVACVSEGVSQHNGPWLLINYAIIRVAK